MRNLNRNEVELILNTYFYIHRSTTFSEVETEVKPPASITIRRGSARPFPGSVLQGCVLPTGTVIPSESPETASLLDSLRNHSFLTPAASEYTVIRAQVETGKIYAHSSSQKVDAEKLRWRKCCA